MKTNYEVKHEVFPNGLSQVVCTCGWASFTTGFYWDAVSWVSLHKEKAHNLTVLLDNEEV